MVGIYPYQQRIIDNLMQYKGRGALQITGRQLGKSYWTNQAIDRLMKDLTSQPISELVLSEGTVYGARYYCVEPIGGNWWEMESWCHKVYGYGSSNVWSEDKAPEPAKRWYMNNRKFWFRNIKDRDWFIVRWNS